ncbi:Piwi domain-containing protein [Caloramator proteoclasticus]|nr:Piwi domain-containing protein [Caloramator proteoclasticus]
MSFHLEIFKSNIQLKEQKFHEYTLSGVGSVDNFYQLVGQAQYALSSQNKFEFVSRMGDMYLYSLKKLENMPEIKGVKIEYTGCKNLDIKNHKEVYSNLIVYYINKILKYKKIYDKTEEKEVEKYKIKFRKSIFNPVILQKEENKKIYTSIVNRDGIRVYRVFNIMPYIDDHGYAYLRCDINHIFESDKTIYDMMKENKNVIGLKVDYLWTNNTNSTGIIEDVIDKTISDKLVELKGQSLIDYFINNKQEYRVNKFTEEDKKANVIKVKGHKNTFYFIPHSLKQVIDRESLKSIDSKFSSDIEKYIKMDMNYRMRSLSDFLDDIGEIKELGNLRFDFNLNSINELGFKQRKIDKPYFLVSNGKVIKNKTGVFYKGYYLKPNNKIRVAIMCPEGYVEESKNALSKILSFNKNGYIVSNDKTEQKNFAIKSLLDLEYTGIFYKYKLGDITEYKRIAGNLIKNEKEFDLVLCVIPNKSDESNPYSEFKKIWAKHNIPSQMICIDSLKIINNCKDLNNYNGIYYIYEISLGMLAKSGGVPWGLKEINSDVDCFVGLDVGNPYKGIRYPSSSVVFDKNGTLINYFKPEIPQTGEIIVEGILQEIFDEIILSYERKFNQKPKHIVIHRDGFARENINWYINYFSQKNIKFDIVEVKKQGAVKFAIKDKDIFKNPEAGYYLTNGKYAYLVTNDIKIGSPRPLKIEKVYGDTSLDDIVKQIFYLSELHVGSFKKTRLPITTEYADRISKNIMYIPSGCLSKKLFFL